MLKAVSRKKIYRYLLLCVPLLFLSVLCTASCGKRNVVYIGNEQARTDISEHLNVDEDDGLDIWEESFAAEKENGDTVTVKIDVAVESGPDTSSVIGVKRIVLDEDAKERIAKAALGEEVNLKDGVYTGSRDGMSYQMRIGENRILLYPEDITLLVPKELEGAFGIRIKANDGANRCELPEEEAVELAQQFLEEIGISDRSYCFKKALAWTGNMEPRGENLWLTHSVQDGYILYFQQTIQEKQMIQKEQTIQEDVLPLLDDTDINGFWLWQEEEESLDPTDTRMHTIVCVGSHGVFAADIQNIYEITSMEEDISLLPVETVRGIMQKELAEPDGYIAEVDGEFLNYEILNFGHCLLWDDTGERGSYVPAWKLRDIEKDFADITVNAIDGSIITWEQRNRTMPADPAAED